MDRLESLLGSSFSEEFYRTFRVFHDERATRPLLSKLSLLLSVSTDPEYLISDKQGSPFNVAQKIWMEHFTPEQVHRLADLHGLTLLPEQVEGLFKTLGGHPFLTRLALYRLAAGFTEFETLLADASSSTGPFGDHLRRIWQSVLDQPDLKVYLRDLCHGTNALQWSKVLRWLRQFGTRAQSTYDRNWAQTRLIDAGILEAYGNQATFANIVYRDFFCSMFKNETSHL
jgi:hypothetical protein